MCHKKNINYETFGSYEPIALNQAIFMSNIKVFLHLFFYSYLLKFLKDNN